MKRQKWYPKSVKLFKSKVENERFEQTLAEVAEILYKKICQQVVSDRSISTEPPINQLVQNQFKKAASE